MNLKFYSSLFILYLLFLIEIYTERNSLLLKCTICLNSIGQFLLFRDKTTTGKKKKLYEKMELARDAPRLVKKKIGARYIGKRLYCIHIYYIHMHKWVHRNHLSCYTCQCEQQKIKKKYKHNISRYFISHTCIKKYKWMNKIIKIWGCKQWMVWRFFMYILRWINSFYDKIDCNFGWWIFFYCFIIDNLS